jgi:hypothetical protein
MDIGTGSISGGLYQKGKKRIVMAIYGKFMEQMGPEGSLILQISLIYRYLLAIIR